MNPGWFEAAITLHSDCETAFCLLAAWPSPMAVPTAAPGEGRSDGVSSPVSGSLSCCLPNFPQSWSDLPVHQKSYPVALCWPCTGLGCVRTGQAFLSVSEFHCFGSNLCRKNLSWGGWAVAPCVGSGCESACSGLIGRLWTPWKCVPEMMAVAARAQICSEARDAEPRVQPKEIHWKLWGMDTGCTRARCSLPFLAQSYAPAEVWAVECSVQCSGWMLLLIPLWVGTPSQAGSCALKGMQREGESSCCEEGRRHLDQSLASIFHCSCAGGSCWQQPHMRQHCWRANFFSILT